MNLKLSFVIVMVTLLVTSCASTGTYSRGSVSPNRETTYTITGEVLWEGEQYIVYPLAIASYRGVCGKRKGVQIIRVKKARVWYLRLLDIAVWLEPLWEDMSPEDIENLKYHRKVNLPRVAEITEKECEYVPRLTVVPVGSTVEIVNEDRKDHWVVVEGKQLKRRQYVQLYGNTPPVFTLDTPRIHYVPEGAPITFKADQSDQWHLQSGFHVWMEGWVFISDKIWFSSVNEKGLFKINGVPRGVYKVNTWHPLLGYSSTVVSVPDGAQSVIKVSYEETPENIRHITSSYITTAGEVRESYGVWQEIEEW
jgi:plastocyanin